MALSAGVVIEADGLPGGAETLALARPEPHVFDGIAHEHPPADGDDPFDLSDMGPELLAACAVAPLLEVAQARLLLGEWSHGDKEAVLAQCIALCLPTAVDRAWWRLERDPRLRAEMDYCAPAGIPHSTFLGSGIGMWSEHDRELALAWDLRRKATCPRCATRRDQWKGDPQAFDVDAYDCPGCYALSRAGKHLKDGQSEHVHLFLTPASGDDEGPADDDLDDDGAG